MGAVLVLSVTLMLTLLAFWKANELLHFVCMIAWLVSGYVLYNQYFAGNTFLPTAAFMVAIGMVLTHLVMVITRLWQRRVIKDAPPNYDAEKDSLKEHITKIGR
jgi:uncharacterized membrane protein